jgi:sugar phosphate isomerase/epimerase
MTEPLFSICELGLPTTDFEQDLDLCGKLGISGLSVDEKKVENLDFQDLRDRLARLAIRPAVCAPRTLSILPSPAIPGPDKDPELRAADICKSISRFAALDPTTVFLATGPAGEYDAASARRIVVDGVRAAAQAAKEAGVVLSIEPMRPAHQAQWTIITSLPEAFNLIEEVGEDIKITYDVWHLWNSPDILPLTKRYADQIVGVQISDYRNPTRMSADRLLPGQGIIDLPSIFGALEQGGYSGWYDLEVFSDFSLPDSIWKREPLDWVGDGKRGFTEAWEKRY